MTDLDLVQACSDAYTLHDEDWTHSWSTDDIHVRHRVIDGADIVAFRGTKDTVDWLADLKAWPTDDPVLGMCHAGFLDGADRVFSEVLPVLGQTIYVTGHSLGAARAVIFAALCRKAGRPPAAVVGFGCPRPGGSTLAGILEGTPIRLYRNGLDPVTEVPLGLLYRHPAPLIQIGNANSAHDPIQDHFIASYCAALRDYENQRRIPA